MAENDHIRSDNINTYLISQLRSKEQTETVAPDLKPAITKALFNDAIMLKCLPFLTDFNITKDCAMNYAEALKIIITEFDNKSNGNEIMKSELAKDRNGTLIVQRPLTKQLKTVLNRYFYLDEKTWMIIGIKENWYSLLEVKPLGINDETV